MFFYWKVVNLVVVKVEQRINKYQAERQFPKNKVLGVEQKGRYSYVKLGGKNG